MAHLLEAPLKELLEAELAPAWAPSKCRLMASCTLKLVCYMGGYRPGKELTNKVSSVT